MPHDHQERPRPRARREEEPAAPRWALWLTLAFLTPMALGVVGISVLGVYYLVTRPKPAPAWTWAKDGPRRVGDVEVALGPAVVQRDRLQIAVAVTNRGDDRIIDFKVISAELTDSLGNRYTVFDDATMMDGLDKFRLRSIHRIQPGKGVKGAFVTSETPVARAEWVQLELVTVVLHSAKSDVGSLKLRIASGDIER